MQDEMQSFLKLLNRERVVLTAITPGPQKTIRSEQFTDPERATTWVAEHNAKGFNCYWTVNVTRDVAEKLRAGKRPSSEDIERIFAFKMDVDPVRPKDTSATEAEKQAMQKTVLAPLYQFLCTNLGKPMVVDSGNGANVLVRLDPMPAASDKEFQHNCDTFMDFLAAKFDVPDVAILDTSVKDLPRVLAFPSIKMKGENTPERPWRQVTLVDAGEPVPLNEFIVLVEEIADLWGDRKIRRWVESLPMFDEFHNGKLSLVGYLKKHAQLDEDVVTRVTDLYCWLHGKPGWDMIVEKADSKRMIIDTFAKDDESISIEHLTDEQKDALGKVFIETKKQEIMERFPSLKPEEPPEAEPKVEIPPAPEAVVVKLPRDKKPFDVTSDSQLTDDGNAQRFAEDYRGSLFYITETGKWVFWDGVRWTTDHSGAYTQRLAINSVYRFIERVANEPVMTNRKEALRHGVSSLNANRTDSSVKLTRGLLATTSSKFDQNPWLLNTLSGTVDLRTGELREARAEDMLTALAPVKYDPDAKCPLWEKFLGEILPDIPMDYLQKWYGYCLTADARERKFQIRQGREGKNGKTTEKNTVLHVLGDYTIEVSIAMFIGKKRDYKGDDLVALRNKRLVFASEPDDNVILNVSMLKQVVGRDTIRCRQLHSNTWFEFEARFKIAIITNPKPAIYNSAAPIWDRIHLIPYNVVFPEEKQDKELEDKLKAEAPGILAWMVRGCLLWQKEGLTTPTRIRQATNEYRVEQDTFGQFLTEFKEIYPKPENSWIQQTQFYSLYHIWCERYGSEPLGPKRFSQELQHRGFKTERRGAGMFYHVQ